jgi:hypothetical protein
MQIFRADVLLCGQSARRSAERRLAAAALAPRPAPDAPPDAPTPSLQTDVIYDDYHSSQTPLRSLAASLAAASLPSAALPLVAAAACPLSHRSRLQLTGRSGELVADLYAAGTKGKNFEKLVKEVEGFVAAVSGSGLIVDRFFATGNYSPEECKKVIELLTTTKEPLTSFKDIKDAEIREVLVDNEGNLDAWRSARKAVSGLALSEPVKALLETLAAEGHLERVKSVATKAADLRAVTSKQVDATITSAVALSKAQQDAVKAALPT